MKHILYFDHSKNKNFPGILLFILINTPTAQQHLSVELKANRSSDGALSKWTARDVQTSGKSAKNSPLWLLFFASLGEMKYLRFQAARCSQQERKDMTQKRELAGSFSGSEDDRWLYSLPIKDIDSGR